VSCMPLRCPLAGQERAKLPRPISIDVRYMFSHCSCMVAVSGLRRVLVSYMLDLLLRAPDERSEEERDNERWP